MRLSSIYTWSYRISYIYLVLPFIIFCIGWLNLPASILFTAIAIWATYQVLQTTPADDPQPAKLSKKIILVSVAILGVWVLLSGVGGYAFQNWDHHWRNAVFRDLINYQWPVIYPTQDIADVNTPLAMLAYYVGFWLPAASIGKLFGWEIANLSLFIWTWVGVVLVVVLLQKRFKAAPLAVILLLIFFSGMDILGMLLRHRINPLDAFSFWPPIARLENWTTLVQYSSNTTQLFWVFNQAIPSWLVIVLFITQKNDPFS